VRQLPPQVFDAFASGAEKIWEGEAETTTMPAADGSAPSEISFGPWRLLPARRRLLADGRSFAHGYAGGQCCD
jgi:hypothetical protein